MPNRVSQGPPPEFVAAVVNGLLFVFVPTIATARGIYTSTAVRPVPPTPVSSIRDALPIALWLAPLGLLVAWRTYIHARAYRRNRFTAWRGPAESALIAGTIALVIMALATARTWTTHPPHLVIGYFSFYVGATTLLGLGIGVVLATTALLVLHLPFHPEAMTDLLDKEGQPGKEGS